MPSLTDIFERQASRKELMMKDRHGRLINYMRISVTDKCNLRCRYCMPEGASDISSAAHCSFDSMNDISGQTLTFDEILRIAQASVKAGISRIRLTGGEPLIRRDIVSLIENIKEIDGIERIALTTNGIFLKEQLKELTRAGLDSVSISLDTIERDKYKAMTGIDGLPSVLSAIDETKKYEDLEVKINSVVIRGFNDSEICDLALLAEVRDISVRFIELMPIGPGKEYEGMSRDDVKQRLESSLCKKLMWSRESCGASGCGPAEYYRVCGFAGKIGFISPMSHNFCKDCNRIRLTADGRLRLCLQYEDGIDLKPALRSGAGRDELTEIIKRKVLKKPEGHTFAEEAACQNSASDRSPDGRSGSKKIMSQIGG